MDYLSVGKLKLALQLFLDSSSISNPAIRLRRGISVGFLLRKIKEELLQCITRLKKHTFLKLK